MELLLLQLVALLRPLASIDWAAAIFEIVGVGLFGLLVAALLADSAVRKSLIFSAVDAAILSFSVWCLAIYVIYFHAARIGEVAKLVIPLLSYIVVKNVVRDRSEYETLLRWMLVGFSIPIVISTVLIATGHGLDSILYWTKEPRWRGAYEGSHTLGHSMTLFLIILVLYIEFPKFSGLIDVQKRSIPEKLVLGVLAGAALYCLYMSQVRTAIVGLIIFLGMYFFFTKRKVFVIGALGLVILAVSTLPYWFSTLLPEYAMREEGIKVTTMELGSGRPTMWLNDLKVFANAPIDQELAGVGIGNRGEHRGPLKRVDYVIYGHSDWLELLTQTGIMGVLLFSWIQISLLRKIMRVKEPEKYMFLAIFSSVNFMMLISNSYAWRIQVGQIYYMVLAYIEIQQLHFAETSEAVSLSEKQSL